MEECEVALDTSVTLLLQQPPHRRLSPSRHRRPGLPLAALLALLALLPIASLPRGASVDQTECESPASATQRRQVLARLGVETWHATGYRGRGVKIAILDSGFRGYREHLGSSLPSEVKTCSFRIDRDLEGRNSQHGILCGEVIHALAPEAELLFANWEPDQPRQFLEAARWAVAEGARLISCSVIMPSWSDGEGGGRTHAELARLLGTDKSLFFASAGNTAERHWSGPFQDDGTGLHVWTTSRTANPLTPWGLDKVSVELCTRTATAYELSVWDRTLRSDVGHDIVGSREGHGRAVVHVYPRSNHEYEVRVRLRRGQPGPFHLVALSGSLEIATARGSIPFPADGPAVIAVGAVDEDGQRMNYSSCGPNSSQHKPNLVAAVPFPSEVRSRPFGGTSAAAPQAAALAALWWSRHPQWTGQQVREALHNSARDVGAPGPDFETGHGQIRLPAPTPRVAARGLKSR